MVIFLINQVVLPEYSHTLGTHSVMAKLLEVKYSV